MATTKTKSTKRHKRQPAASPSRINERQRRAQALELRLTGMGFQGIADELGFADKSGAYRAVMAELNEAPAADAEKLRIEQSARLDAIVANMWPLLIKGDAAAARTIIRAEERRAKLMGIDLDPKAAEMLQLALATSANAQANAQAIVIVIGGEQKSVEALTDAEMDAVEAHVYAEAEATEG